MYLKSIEVQGFKSFANKIVFEFHNGITGIVGPNGSGKSNVADAVRWVLGEQSAKQLRGAKMEDVIFSGTELRKPVGFAYVAITIDNSDRALAIDYDQVTVSRRVYRSGESEYLINGTACRLKDVNELFYDTGIGKEGYSIIGQGQIDKILSGKPEERRELFDEAAGIVKFKRRKAIAQKKLEDEKQNLVRVNDILAELEKQFGPLEKQSEKARTYLRYKDELKKYDINLFLNELKKTKELIAEVEEKKDICSNDLDETNRVYENTKVEYEKLEEEIEQINDAITNNTEAQNEYALNKGNLEGRINLLLEQIKTVKLNDEHLNERKSQLSEQIDSKEKELLEYQEDLKAIEKEISLLTNDNEDEKQLEELTEHIKELNSTINELKSFIIDNLNEKSNIKSKVQHYETMLDQINIRKAQITQRLLKAKSDADAHDSTIERLEHECDEANVRAESINATISELQSEESAKKDEIKNIDSDMEKAQQQYHIDKSKLESLKNITERYDGYGNSIRKVMELRDTNKGIIGVVADIIKVDSKYEVAIETALGGSIQNIVTDNENTARDLITFLKTSKSGRATFLPLSSISGKDSISNEAILREKGVIGIASDLVHVDKQFTGLVKYLLGRNLVVDTIDNAIQIARKYKYSTRIVTLEGELLNPGGSMTGGAFKNNSNLLGRRREIEELDDKVKESERIRTEFAAKKEAKNIELFEVRKAIEENNKLLQDTYLVFNTAKLNLRQAKDRKSELEKEYNDTVKESSDIEEQIKEIKDEAVEINATLRKYDTAEADARTRIDILSREYEKCKTEEELKAKECESKTLSMASFNQRKNFINENIIRTEREKEKIVKELEGITGDFGKSAKEVSDKEQELDNIRKEITALEQKISECEESIFEHKQKREEMQKTHKTFFEKRDNIQQNITNLEKEKLRLESLYEKYQEANESRINYMWNEYEITYSAAQEFRDEELTDISEMKKQISLLKADIRELGDVNVNAIEDYKEISERYTFMKTQHDDLITAEETLIGIIDELDAGMRTQFAEKFAEIKDEFDKVFKELFGGGKGSIELVEDEDILEAGIRIISQPPGKKLQNMMQLSGGEKALTAIALLFAIQNLKPSPFCLLDEIEAALDDSNVDRYARYLHKLTKHTQFIVITHRRGTMASADRLYGITMQEKGISTLVSVDLIENELEDKKE
ncbi:MAG: chromosome segregation protein SMC [Lachnospiraceae bacterium]|nr:chromosome segregation protein SMC [Lachnospiraceae bacterium]